MTVKTWITIFMTFSLAACSSLPVSPSPTQSPTLPLSASTPTHLPTETPVQIPSNTPEPTIQVTATVWPTDPKILVLIYHEFSTAKSGESTVMKVRLDDLKDRLETLDENGYSLIRLEDWLDGKLQVPAGRRPLIITIDDAYANNQMALDPSGNPSPDTGIGVIWQFSQNHPDFGFHLAVFTNLNQPFDNPDNPNREFVKAQNIVWGIEHDAVPYNHIWMHPRLDETPANEIKDLLRKNDDYLRELLAMAGRSDLVSRVANIIALPEGLWPADSNGRKILMEYQNPEGQPVKGVMEAMTPYDFRDLNLPKFLEAPYGEGYSPFHVPRTDGSPLVIQYLVDHRADFPAAISCGLNGVNPNRVEDPAYWQDFLNTHRGSCPDGIYAIENMAFRVNSAGITRLLPKP